MLGLNQLALTGLRGGGTPAVPVTNLLSYSEEFDNAAWSKVNGTIIPNAILAPDGTLTADRFVENGLTGDHGVQRVATVTSGTPCTQSFYVKKSGRSWVYIDPYTDSPSYTFFNLDTGTLGTVGSGTTATITDVGDGWYRISATRTPGGSGIYAVLRSATADGLFLGVGDNTSGFYVWGAQLETGSVANGYVKTT